MLSRRNTCGNLSEKGVHTQLVRERLSTVASARWAAVNYPDLWSGVSTRELIPLYKKKKKIDRRGMIRQTLPQNPRTERKATITTTILIYEPTFYISKFLVALRLPKCKLCASFFRPTVNKRGICTWSCTHWQQISKLPDLQCFELIHWRD